MAAMMRTAPMASDQSANRHEGRRRTINHGDHMFISFEGIDGCGKSTQVRMLEQVLRQQGRDVLVVREPGATPLSEAVRNVLLTADFAIDPMAELLLFCASRRQLVQTVIRPALDRGSVVICDRYADSSTAYQGYGRGLDVHDVSDANRLATEGLMPTVTFFLDITVEESSVRAAQRGDAAPDRMEKAGVDFFERVRSGYQAMASRWSDRIVCIPGSMGVEEIHAHIMAEIHRRDR